MRRKILYLAILLAGITLSSCLSFRDNPIPTQPTLSVYFTSEEELSAFITTAKITIRLFPDDKGVVRFSGLCYDTAEALQVEAFKQGKLLQVQVHSPLDTGTGEAHAICSTRIGNIIYFIDTVTCKYWQMYYIP